MAVPAAPPVSAGATRPPIAALSVMAAAVFAAITTEILPVGLLSVMGHDLRTSDSRVGLLVSAYAIVVAGASVPLTALAARWPRRQVLCGLLVTYAFSNAIMASTDDYWVAFGARLLGGLAHAGFFSVVVAAAVSLVPPERAGRAIAFVGVGNALALGLGVPLGTALGTAIGWRWAFAGCAAVMVILAALTAAILPKQQPSPSTSGNLPILTAVRGRPILIVAAMIVIFTLGHYTLYAYVSPLLLHAGVHPSGVSLVLLGYGLAGILGLVLAGAVVDRFPWGALLVTMAFTTACLVLLGLVGGTTFTVAIVVVWGLAFGLQPTLIQTVAQHAVSRAPDTASAVVNTTFNIGIAGGALIGARELLIASPPALALTGSVLTALALIMLMTSKNHGD